MGRDGGRPILAQFDKDDQEVTLAVRLRRDAFDEFFLLAVHSRFVPEFYPSLDL